MVNIAARTCVDGRGIARLAEHRTQAAQSEKHIVLSAVPTRTYTWIGSGDGATRARAYTCHCRCWSLVLPRLRAILFFDHASARPVRWRGENALTRCLSNDAHYYPPYPVSRCCHSLLSALSMTLCGLLLAL